MDRGQQSSRRARNERVDEGHRLGHVNDHPRVVAGDRLRLDMEPAGMTELYFTELKTAVSIPDELFRAADDHARRFGMSRSEVYARALERYLADASDDVVTRALDELYEAEDSALDERIAAAQRRATSA